MEAPGDVMGSHSSSSTGGDDRTNPTDTVTTKRKRTKRQRAAPVPFSPNNNNNNNIPDLSSTSSIDVSSTTEEEEDMAHCLILLAQGRAFDCSPPALSGGSNGGGGGNTVKFVSRKFTETMTTAGGKAGFYVYECKTCNKCFPSFQALGGHRASHKKPKMLIQSFPSDDPRQISHERLITDGINIHTSSPTGTNSCSNGKLRVHECSICGAEFSSGQALGGHMRRHRPIVAGPPELQEVIKKERSSDLLSLDLNLPAPTEEPTVAFLPTMAFSATSALVDCHY